MKSFVFRSDKAFNPARLEDFLGSIVQVYGPKMLRYKGVLNMKGTDRKVIFQGVHQLMGSDLGPKWAPAKRSRARWFSSVWTCRVTCFSTASRNASFERPQRARGRSPRDYNPRRPKSRHPAALHSPPGRAARSEEISVSKTSVPKEAPAKAAPKAVTAGKAAPAPAPVTAKAAAPAPTLPAAPAAAMPAPARKSARGAASRPVPPQVLAPAPTSRFADRFAPPRPPTRQMNNVELDTPRHTHKSDPKLANAWKTKAGAT